MIFQVTVRHWYPFQYDRKWRVQGESPEHAARRVAGELGLNVDSLTQVSESTFNIRDMQIFAHHEFR